MPRFALAIEISNPSSGPRGRIDVPDSGTVLAGPGIALAPLNDDGSHDTPDTELLHESGRHDDDLMPAIGRLFRRAGARASDLARIAVSVGPGGYTSLRIAIATAKMLAEATGAEVVPVPSASVAAWCLPIVSAPALVCLASKGATVHATLLPALSRSDWWPRTGRLACASLLSQEDLAALDQRIAAGKGWIAAAQPLGLLEAHQTEGFRPATLVGDRFLPETFRAAAARIGATILEPAFAASSVLSIARGLPAANPLALAPIYPRQAEAVTQWRLRHPA